MRLHPTPGLRDPTPVPRSVLIKREETDTVSVTPSFNMVFFGGTGDLVMRKLLPAMYQCHRVGQLAEHGRLLCLGRRELSQEQYPEM